MRFESKIAVVLAEDLAVWQKLNVTAFLASGIAARTFKQPSSVNRTAV